MFGTQMANASLSSNCKNLMTKEAINSSFEAINYYKRGSGLTKSDIKDLLLGQDSLAEMVSLRCGAMAQIRWNISDSEADKIHLEAFNFYKIVRAQKLKELSQEEN